MGWMLIQHPTQPLAGYFPRYLSHATKATSPKTAAAPKGCCSTAASKAGVLTKRESYIFDSIGFSHEFDAHFGWYVKHTYIKSVASFGEIDLE